MAIKTKDLIYGAYYRINNEFILCFKGFKPNREAIEETDILSITPKYFYENNYIYIDRTNKITPATDLEIQWLNECITAKKYVPKPKQLNKPTLWL